MSPDSPALLMLAMLAFPLIMFTSGIISVFDLTLLPAVFCDIHHGHNKKALRLICPAEKNILFGIPQ